jgi:hypothetical protein|eukprot:Transcript_19952.p1 GENE.Transcript_19952~~Transcript_19952.p1  ORF type:complete len:179 (-),score=31.90 Transcript_19952:49-585(-)
MPPSESTPSESDAFWPSVMGDERAPFWPSEPAQPPAHRFRPFDLRGSSGVAAAARPSLLHRRSGLGLQPRQQLGPGGAIAAVAFALLGAAVGVLLVRAQAMQPLFPLAAESLAWNAEWLTVAAADYYCACLCLCGVIACSEPRGQAVCWCLGCCVLGAPVCCLYVSARLCRYGSLSLT